MSKRKSAVKIKYKELHKDAKHKVISLELLMPADYAILSDHCVKEGIIEPLELLLKKAAKQVLLNYKEKGSLIIKEATKGSAELAA